MNRRGFLRMLGLAPVAAVVPAAVAIEKIVTEWDDSGPVPRRVSRRVIYVDATAQFETDLRRLEAITEQKLAAL